MSSIEGTQPSTARALLVDPEAAAQPAPVEPETAYLGDGLAVMLFLMERSAQNSMAAAEVRINDTRAAIKEQLDDFLKQIADAIRAAEKARKDDGGWFSNLVGDIVGVVGKILGPVIEHTVELTTYQFDLVCDTVNSIQHNQNLLANFTRTTLELGQTGQISEDVRGFAEGAARFMTDLAEFIAKAHVALARAAATGESAADILGADADVLRQSLERNIVDNPHFIKVASAAAKAASVAAVAATAGGAAPIAVTAIALLAAVEVDNRTGVLDKVFKDAAPYVRIALQFAAAACAAYSGGGTDKLIESLSRVTLAIDAACGAYRAARTLIEGHREADALDAQAEQLATLQAMHRLQRLVEQLIESLEDDAETHTENRELGAQALATRADAEAAAIIPA